MAVQHLRRVRQFTYRRSRRARQGFAPAAPRRCRRIARHCRFPRRMVFERLAKAVSRRRLLARSISSIFSGCLPPTSAKSGRPPPPPPTRAISFTIWPALTREVRSAVTATTIWTLPSFSDAMMTTPLLIWAFSESARPLSASLSRPRLFVVQASRRQSQLPHRLPPVIRRPAPASF